MKFNFFADMFIYKSSGSEFYKLDIVQFDAWGFNSKKMTWESSGIDSIGALNSAFHDVKATKMFTFSKKPDLETDHILVNEFKHRRESTVLNPKAPIMDRELNPNRTLSTFSVSFSIEGKEEFKQTLLLRIPTVIDYRHTAVAKIGKLNIFTLKGAGEVEIFDY